MLVSILILLEVILEVAKTFEYEAYDQSFNPYFTGSNSGSETNLLINVTSECFNPYFTGSNSGSVNDPDDLGGET